MPRNIALTDFCDPRFTDAFMRYFAELGICVRDWEGLWNEMNRSDVSAFLRLFEERAIGLIQYQAITANSAFFEERLGFVRELWVDPASRGEGHGGALLEAAEAACRAQGITRMILTTDTAEAFYLRHGYRARPDILAKNRLPVYEKLLT